METMVLAGVLSAVGMFFLLLRIGPRFMARHATLIDILFTTSLVVMFFGTFSGMLAAALGGVILSVLLWIVKLAVKR